MRPVFKTPLIRLGNLFPDRQVFAKCEFLAPGGSFKIRGAEHLLDHLSRESSTRQLIVPSMGNTAIGAATGAKEFGFSMIGVVPPTLAAAKEDRLQRLGVELVKVPGGGSELLRTAKVLAQEKGGYFVHPHLDPLWTDGYQVIAEQILSALPACRSLVVPIGGGGLLLGLMAGLERHTAKVKLFGCEAFNYPTYAAFTHQRSATIADGLVLENPHPLVRQKIDAWKIDVHLIEDDKIRAAMAVLFNEQGLTVEPSSAITVALVQAHDQGAMEEPICVVLTGENITREDFHRLIGTI
jgi:threonine dehydratase